MHLEFGYVRVRVLDCNSFCNFRIWQMTIIYRHFNHTSCVSFSTWTLSSNQHILVADAVLVWALGIPRPCKPPQHEDPEASGADEKTLVACMAWCYGHIGQCRKNNLMTFWLKFIFLLVVFVIETAIMKAPWALKFTGSFGRWVVLKCVKCVLKHVQTVLPLGLSLPRDRLQ